MAQVFWTPDPADDGNAPSDITYSVPWTAITSVTVIDPGGGGEVALNIDFGAGSNARKAIRISEIAGLDIDAVDDIEIYVDYQISGSGHDHYTLGRMAGSDGSEVAVWGRKRRATGTGSLSLGEYAAPTTTLLASANDTEIGFIRRHMRLRLNGTSAEAKFWNDGDAEPGSWTLSGTIDAATGGGAGFQRFDNANGGSFPSSQIYKIGIGTGGDAAPTEPVAGGGEITGDATLAADVAEFSATGVTTIGGSASLEAEAAQFSATGVNTISGSAALEAQDAGFSASGITQINGTAGLIAWPAEFSASGETAIYGQLGLVAQPAELSLAGTTTISGVLSMEAQSATFRYGAPAVPRVFPGGRSIHTRQLRPFT